MKETTREHLEFHLRRLKGARAAAAEMALKPRSGGLELLAKTHSAVLALEAVLADGIEPEHSALAEVAADLDQAAATPPSVSDWWRASMAPLSAFAEAARRR